MAARGGAWRAPDRKSSQSVGSLADIGQLTRDVRFVPRADITAVCAARQLAKRLQERLREPRAAQPLATEKSGQSNTHTSKIQRDERTIGQHAGQRVPGQRLCAKSGHSERPNASYLAATKGGQFAERY